MFGDTPGLTFVKSISVDPSTGVKNRFLITVFTTISTEMLTNRYPKYPNIKIFQKKLYLFQIRYIF